MKNYSYVAKDSTGKTLKGVMEAEDEQQAINMDFRSLYLHFENAAYVYGRETAADILNDFYNIFRRSEEVTDKYINKPRILRIGQCILRLVAPLF